MARSVIAYERELPEIPDRRPWERPTSHLVRDTSVDSHWRVDDSGRRPSDLLLINKIRRSVDEWREGGYLGASQVSLRLFDHWFEQDHEVEGFSVPFRYYFCQREAIESLIWLVEVAKIMSPEHLIKNCANIVPRDLVSNNVNFQTTVDGRRQLLTYGETGTSPKIQALPPESLRRFAFKMATGSGKTWVMAMAIVWSYFHKIKVTHSTLSTNFLIVAPNVIVYQRLVKDFANGRIFTSLPLIPSEWKREFHLNVILRDESIEPDAKGNLFLTNIHQLYPPASLDGEPKNAVAALLGPKPQNSLFSASRRSLIDRIVSSGDLVVLNDEAHHVHNEDLQWSKSLFSISERLPASFAIWLDFSATPKDQEGNYFPWIICDYPLAQAVEDRIVKAPIVFEHGDTSTAVSSTQEKITAANVVDTYRTLILASMERLARHSEVYDGLGVRPVLFIMTEKSIHADKIGEYLVETAEFKLDQSEVLVIHTNSSGEIRKRDLEIARKTARDIDTPDNRIKVIVSVMMLREGWDVRNVTVVLGLRPFSAQAEILPEQVIGRGLRLMTQVTPDRTQTLEVLGTPNLLKSIQEQLEAEGVGVGVTRKPPLLPVVIQPLKERITYDIEIPISRPSLEHITRRLADLDVSQLRPIYSQDQLDQPLRIELRMRFVTTETEVGRTVVVPQELPSEELVTGITKLLGKYSGITRQFSALYPIVLRYIRQRCFGRVVSIQDDQVRRFLSQLQIRDAIAQYLALEVSQLTIERHDIELVNAGYRLSETRAFSWRRDLPPPAAERTVFNFVATYNGFEREFAEFLDSCSDILRFAALGTTEQGSSGTTFRVDYVKPSGAIGFYYPDWVVVQNSEIGILHWIVETKGRIWAGTEEKDAAIEDWCTQITRLTGTSWQYLRVNQSEFSSQHSTFRELAVTLVANSMFRERASQPQAVSWELIRALRDEVGR